MQEKLEKLILRPAALELMLFLLIFVWGVHTVPNMTLQITLYFTFVFCQNLNFAKKFHQRFYDFHGAHLDDFSSKMKKQYSKN